MKSFRTTITAFILGLVCCGTLQAQEWLTNGLVAFYQLDGSASDTSGHAVNGTMAGVAFNTNRLGFPSKAFRFQGTNGSFVDMGVPVSLQFGGDFTLGAWVNFSGGEPDARILSYGGAAGYELLAAGDGTNRQLQFNVAGTNILSAAMVASGEWHHVAARLEGSTASLFVDGVLVGTNEVSTSAIFSGNFYLARSETGNYWGGALDDVSCYNRALSTGELADLFSTGPVTRPIFNWAPTYQTNYVLTSISFSVEAIGPAPITYRVLKFNGTNFATLNGQTNGTLVLNNLMTNDAGVYLVEASNSYGTTTNGIVQLTVNRLPQTITYFQPLPTNSVIGDPPIKLVATSSSGLPVHFSVIVNGSVAEIYGDTLYLKSVGSTYILAQPIFGDAIYASSAGIYQIFTVGGVPLAITAQPTNQLANVGDAAAVSLSAVGTGSMAYRLQKQSTVSTTNSTTNVVINGLTNIVTTPSYPNPPPTAGIQTNIYYVTVAVLPDPVPYGMVTNILTVYTSTTAYPAPGTYVGTPTRQGSKWFYYHITGTNYTYPTFTFTYPVVTYTTNFITNTTVTSSSYYVTTLQSGLTLSNELNAAFVLPNVQTTDAGNYLVVITNHSGAVTSSIVTLTVNRLPVSAPDVFICKGNSALNIPIAGVLQNDSDPDGDVPSLLEVSPLSVNQGSVSRDGAFITYTPPTVSSNATDHFSYTITDGRTGVATATVTIRLAPAPTLSGAMTPEGFIVIAADAVSGVTYLLQAGTNSGATISWQTVGTNTPTSDGPIQFLDPEATNLPARLYRVLMP